MKPAFGSMVFAVAVLLVLLPSVAAHAQPIEGVWIAELRSYDRGDVTSRVWVRLEARTATDRHRVSFSVPRDEFEGLRIAPGDADASEVHFTLSREAGRFVFDGRFRGGTGSGEMRLEIDAAYVRAMERLGFPDLTDDELFALAVYDVTTTFVEELRALGYTDLRLDERGNVFRPAIPPGRSVRAFGAGAADPALPHHPN